MATKEQHSFLFADISGYSALTEEHGDEAAADLAIRFAREVAELASEHGAELVKRVGDGVMVRCDTAAAAVRLALGLHAKLSASSFPQIHAGVHTGMAVARGGDWWGATVNIAARVAAAAEAGQLLITEATKAAAGELNATQLRGLGPRRFKNISNPVRVYLASERPEPAPVMQSPYMVAARRPARGADLEPLPVPTLAA